MFSPCFSLVPKTGVSFYCVYDVKSQKLLTDGRIVCIKFSFRRRELWRVGNSGKSNSVRSGAPKYSVCSFWSREIRFHHGVN